MHAQKRAFGTLALLVSLPLLALPIPAAAKQAGTQLFFHLQYLHGECRLSNGTFFCGLPEMTQSRSGFEIAEFFQGNHLLLYSH